MTGKKEELGTLQFGENVFELNQGKIGTGLYVLKVTNAIGNVISTQKFVIQ